MGHKHSRETIEKIRQSKLGVKRSEESKKKQSLKNTGENNPMSYKSIMKRYNCSYKLAKKIRSEIVPVWNKGMNKCQMKNYVRKEL